MRISFIVLACLLTLVSCDHSDKLESFIGEKPGLTRNKEDFINIDPTALNLTLSNTTDVKSAEDIVKLYYNKTADSVEGNEEITIKSTKQDEKISVVTLIHDNIVDDSMRTMKVIMMIIHIENRWKIISLRQNWRCYPGRGDTNWTINSCN